jgi:hypothetical protein
VTESNTDVDPVERYLEQLRIKLRFGDAPTRSEYLTEIHEHIVESRAELEPGDSDGIDGVLSRLGSPEALARAFNETQQEVQAEALKNMGTMQRLRRRALPVTLLALTVLLASVILSIAHYQPLFTSLGGSGGEKLVMANGKMAPTVPDASNVVDNPTIWKMTPGTSTLTITVNLYNAGRLPITITAFPSSLSGPIFGSAHVRIRLESTLNSRPFRAFSLGGHQTRVAEISVPIHCQVSPDESTDINQVPVTTSFFGVGHSLMVDVIPFDILYANTCK